MKVAILGATAGIGRALARQLAERGDRVFLLGRNAESLEKSAADLDVRREGALAGTALCDLEDPGTFDAALDAADVALESFETFVITAADFATQDDLEADVDRAHRLLVVNFANTIALCERVRKRLLERGGGTLVVFSSVAGERGRKPVVLYGASKAGLSAYLEGLDHRFRAAGLKTVTIKPGFVKTGMTAGLSPPPFAGLPEDVARDVLKAIDRGKPVTYTPLPWALVMFVIRHLPRAVMRRIGF